MIPFGVVVKLFVSDETLLELLFAINDVFINYLTKLSVFGVELFERFLLFPSFV